MDADKPGHADEPQPGGGLSPCGATAHDSRCPVLVWRVPAAQGRRGPRLTARLSGCGSGSSTAPGDGVAASMRWLGGLPGAREGTFRTRIASVSRYTLRASMTSGAWSAPHAARPATLLGRQWSDSGFPIVTPSRKKTVVQALRTQYTPCHGLQTSRARASRGWLSTRL